MSRYRVKLTGEFGQESGLIMHDGLGGLDTDSPERLEIADITRTKTSDRSEAQKARIKLLEVLTCFWKREDDTPTVPAAAIRSMIERAARKLKQGPLVREGLIVEIVESFEWDKTLGKDIDELASNEAVRFTVPVKVGQARILRTRPRFREWAVTFVLDCDDELIDAGHIENWLDIGGRRIGLGDWRPEKSGTYGRFETTSFDKIG